jgi:hypothetical protein
VNLFSNLRTAFDRETLHLTWGLLYLTGRHFPANYRHAVDDGKSGDASTLMCPSPVFGYFKLEPLMPSAMIINRPDLITAVSKLAALFSAPKSLTQLQQMGLVSWLSTARHRSRCGVSAGKSSRRIRADTEIV